MSDKETYARHADEPSQLTGIAVGAIILFSKRWGSFGHQTRYGTLWPRASR